MRKALAFIAGMMAGMVTGGVLTLLLAPQPGAELRGDIESRINQLIEEGKMAAETRRQELETQLEAFRQGHPISLTPAESPERAA